MRMLAQLFFAIAILLPAAPAGAQALSPFADPASIVQTRDAAPNATIEIRYAATLTEQGATRHLDLVFDVAPDWVLVRRGNEVWLQDFRLDRMFILNEADHTYVSYNAVALVAFRVMERQNRAMLAQMLARAGAEHTENLADDCDAESELGVAFPGSAAQTSLRETGGLTELRCNTRTMGSFRAGRDAPPTSLWPALAQTINMHPVLLNSMRASGRIPENIVTNYRNGPAHTVRAEFRLASATAVATPYPLSTDMTNGNAAAIDAVLSAGVGAAGNDAVSGNAMGGPPTVDSWASYLSQVRARDGAAGVAMLLGVTYTMFPEAVAACTSGQSNALCGAITDVRTAMMSEPAVHGMYAIADAERQNHLDEVIPAMTAAQVSPLAHHPVLGEAYALALIRFDDSRISQARAANLPTDPRPLMAAALRAYPYNAAYWTDVASWRGAGYEWMEAMLFYDVANALPRADAVGTVQSANQFFARLHQDFPYFWLAP